MNNPYTDVLCPHCGEFVNPIYDNECPNCGEYLDDEDDKYEEEE